jgi:hypothetical protein
VDHIALLTPRQVIPAAIVEYLEGLYGRDGVVDAQELYYRVKYEKSEVEMRPLFFFGAIPDLPIRYFLPARIHSRLLRQQESDAPHDFRECSDKQAAACAQLGGRMQRDCCF